MRAKDNEAAGRAHGIHVRSLQRAARRLGFRIEKMGLRDGWRWCLPPSAEDDTAPKTTEDVSVSLVSSSGIVSPSKTTETVKPEQVSSSENIDVLSKTTVVAFEDDIQTHSPRAREAAEDGGLPAWVTADDGPAPVLGSADAVFADHDDEGSVQ
jgi:hypothetical protein